MQSYVICSKQMATPIRLPQPHAVLLALSKDCGHAMFAAREVPSMVYVVNVATDTISWTFHPQASSSLIRRGTFHPSGYHKILLSFQDGTIAAYKHEGHLLKTHQPADMEAHETGKLSKTHVAGIELDPIIDAAFLLSGSMRAVTIATDGLCRLVDLNHGGRLLRAWRPPFLPLKLAVLGIEPALSQGDRCIIAVACDTGSVLLYDALGLLRGEVRLPGSPDAIIGLEWCDGFPPVFAKTGETTTSIETLTSIESSLERHDSVLQSPMQSRPNRRFAVHPDELERYKQRACTARITTPPTRPVVTTACPNSPGQRLVTAASQTTREQALASLRRAGVALARLAVDIESAILVLE